MKITVLGCGSWGSAIAHVLSERNPILMLARREEQAKEITEEKTNRRYFPNFQFSENVSATTSLEEALEYGELIINAIPTQSIRHMLKRIAPIYSKTPIINLSKGLEKESGKRISEIFSEELGEDVPYFALSGPSHAEEVILNQPTTVVLAGTDADMLETFQLLFMRPYFRVYTGFDVLGVELGGAVKNVLAIGMGALDGIGLGDNPKAALITRGVHEMVRFGIALGGHAKTLYGLSGLGDLIVTATSRHSRNRLAGEYLGKGHSLEEISELVGQTVEGISTCKAVYDLAKRLGIDMPITQSIYDVLFNGRHINEVSENLMMRSRKQEFEDD